MTKISRKSTLRKLYAFKLQFVVVKRIVNHNEMASFVRINEHVKVSERPMDD